MSYFKAIVHQNWLRLGLRPRPHWEELTWQTHIRLGKLTALPKTTSWTLEVLILRESKGRRKREKKGKGKKAKKRNEGQARHPIQIFCYVSVPAGPNHQKLSVSAMGPVAYLGGGTVRCPLWPDHKNFFTGDFTWKGAFFAIFQQNCKIQQCLMFFCVSKFQKNGRICGFHWTFRSKKCFSLGLRPPDPPTRGSAPGSR